MRRISLALALVGAVAAAGCGGAGGTTPASSGGNKGVEDASFKLVVRGENAYLDPDTSTTIILPKGGVVTASVGGIDCGVDSGGGLHKVCEALVPYNSTTAVTLTATPAAPYTVYGWAGACGGMGACSFFLTDTKFVGVRFATSTAGLGAHAGFTQPAIHGQEFFKAVDVDGVFLTTTAPAGSYNCTACHGGAFLLGSGLAPSCASCHSWPISKGGHFNPAGAMAGHGGSGCGRCHNTDNFRDFTGADGTFAEYVSSVVFTGSQALSGSPYRTPGQMHCDTCHNSRTDPAFGGWTKQKKFPNGNVLTLDSASAICAQCHDGARPGYNVAQIPLSIGNQTDPDLQITASNATVRAHYLSGASTVYGEEAGNWYQYTGMNYTGRNSHGGKNQCTFCHDAHDGSQTKDAQVAAKCGVCHFGEDGNPVATFAQLEETRQYGFEGDIDGDGVVESVKLEIDGLGTKLYEAIQAYGLNVSGTAICNLSQMDNKFYVVADSGIACGTTPNNVTYNKYTPRLLKAAYNFLMYQQDAGAWAHNPRYAIEVLFDTITDLNAGLTAKSPANVVAFAGKRSFMGHFGANEDPSAYAAFVYHGTGAQGFTSAACYQCHGGQGGFETYLAGKPVALASSVMSAANKVTGMECGTCHTVGDNMMGTRTAQSIGTVYFPPQKGNPAPAAQNVVAMAATSLPNSVALCGSCHSGRENGASVDIAVGATIDTSFSLAFKNPHYLGAAGMMLGSTAGVMYQYTGKSYTTTPAFWNNPVSATNGPHGSPHGAACIKCHDPRDSQHSFEVDLTKTIVDGTFYGAANTKTCNECHAGVYSLAPKMTEYEEASAELWAEIQAYATANAPTGVCYNGNANPYFFKVVGGVCQDGVANAPAAAASFAQFNPKLLKAAYNYQWTQKEPGAWAHNEFYVLQAIYDSIVDLGGDPSFLVTASATDATLNRP